MAEDSLTKQNELLRQCLEDVKEHVPSAKRAKIEAVLTSTAAATERTPMTPPSQVGSAGNGGAGVGNSASSSSSASPSKPAPEGTEPFKDAEGGLHFALDKKRRVSVTIFKGNVLVGIREWYEKGDKILPGKGITLKIPEWEALVKNAQPAADAFEKQNYDFVTEIGKARNGEKRLGIRSFKNSNFYEVREYFFDKEQQLRPTRKGSTLSGSVWTRLVELMPHVDKAIADLKTKAAKQ